MIKMIFLLLVYILQLNAETLYISTDGDNNNSGLTHENTFKTLKKAIAVAQEMKLKQNKVTILIAPGVYSTYAHIIHGRKDNKSIEIIGNTRQGEEVIFEPRGGCITWLKLKNSKGVASKLKVEGLVIRKFCTAISFNGNRDNKLHYNSRNIIRNNTFTHIGSRFKNKHSTAAIRLVNSQNNIIENNKFLTIKNKEKCNLLHAIYLAHYSSNNLIKNNTFVDLCGSVIKFRDRSNNNIIQNNYFYGFKKNVAIQESFCDKSRNKKCTKKSGECPSTGNILMNNDIVLDTLLDNKFLSMPKKYLYRTWCDKIDYNTTRILIK